MKDKKAKTENKDKKINESETTNSPGKKKTPIIFYLALILIPVLFFILLEAGLRLFNYGQDNNQWISMPGNKLMLNPEIAYRYFYTTKNIPYSNDDLFDKIKAKKSFRIFVLGESSTAGYPFLPIGSFPRYLKQRLEILYPQSRIEVVNIAMTAINTYALRDMFPGILEQKPDLVLIYTGHNEYYGALGIGSVESLGSNTGMINLILYLNKYKTVELLRNIISSTMKLFSGDKPKSGTLMSRIVKDQEIPVGSDKYNKGLEQFRSNLSDILSMAKADNVPVILGTLTSNLKDQPPFISRKTDNAPDAMEIFNQAKIELNKGNKEQAAKLFRKARDLDCLRFRASEDVNNIIRSAGKQFNNTVIEIDSAFNAMSPQGIVGDNLMMDHLHPTLDGYKVMAKLYYGQMVKSDLVPKTTVKKLNEQQLDILVDSSYKFCRLDSLIAADRIIALKNDWPFIKDEKDKKPFDELIKRKDFIDTLAMQVLFDEVTWEKAHRKAAQWYLDRRNLSDFQNYMDVLIEQYPIIVEYYYFTANKFIELKKYDLAYKYLDKGYAIKHDPYFAKWLGIIDLSKKKTDSAIYYLNISLESDSRDPQTLFNLAGAYVYKNNYNSALEIINRCLEVDPQFPQADQLKAQLVNALRK